MALALEGASRKGSRMPFCASSKALAADQRKLVQLQARELSHDWACATGRCGYAAPVGC